LQADNARSGWPMLKPPVDPLLSGRDMTVRFGGLCAVADVGFDLYPGEVLGVVGPNGAGKSVLINAITKFYPLTKGRLSLQGKDITRHSSRQTARAGLARTFQNIRLFRRMTVLENILVADPRCARWPFVGLSLVSRTILTDAHELLVLMNLREHANAQAGSLSYGQARRLEIARALATKPKVVLLDEPAAGMNELETEQLIADINVLRGSIGGIMLIEHDMVLMRALATRLLALDAGKKICEGSVAEVLDHAQVRASYLGSAA
jgi:branched-chain amino acid transport system ATP-binding protein